MAMPPYGRRVDAMPKAFRDRDARIFVFAGTEAWQAARKYLDMGEPKHARERYVLVAPASVEDRELQQVRSFDPWACRWPVAGRTVLVIDCGMDQRMGDILARALQRDGAREGLCMRYPRPPEFDKVDRAIWGTPDAWVDDQLSAQQTFYLAAPFDEVAARAQAVLDAEREVAGLAWHLEHAHDLELARICAASPHESLGALALARSPRARAALARA